MGKLVVQMCEMKKISQGNGENRYLIKREIKFAFNIFCCTPEFYNFAIPKCCTTQFSYCNCFFFLTFLLRFSIYFIHNICLMESPYCHNNIRYTSYSA